MSGSRCRVLLAIAALFVVACRPAPLFAQGLTGTIDGTVKDETGGVLPGVTVTLASPALIGGARTTSPERRPFRFPALPPGDYAVVFELTGFQKVERPGLIVQSDRTITLDLALRPAAWPRRSRSRANRQSSTSATRRLPRSSRRQSSSRCPWRAGSPTC